MIVHRLILYILKDKSVFPGLVCPEVHVCGEETAVDLICRLAESCGEQVEVRQKKNSNLQ